ncbi:MAG TPA: class 1 isoprenoid biosynthesis enzyme [Candidatus Sumerlaeota bacterium]|nr:class 1 isoprenoid biosynthesis enzyme [Candidatus Sumerlaeota bacterium]HOR26553.1 class 1 isoprenoid biosynthesis enzyme [Candidatus Sumerlaeota bacterium]HPK00884.1 class 1 isoprenoid biosynthesis enzyme [Candidatus Sumerlaeota bacterium]
MTLSPVFRSERAVRLLEEHGIWGRLSSAAAQQAEGVQWVAAELGELISERHLAPPADDRPLTPGDGPLSFMQEYFFLTLFLSLFESLGISPDRFPFYARLNFCIKGTITAADNLFDGQSKSLLPLREVEGACFGSILQLMCFERLLRRVGDRAVNDGLFSATAFAEVQRGLLDRMAEIGLLEGSEEAGVSEIPTPRQMIDHVHRVRGGMLFGLAFVAPAILERGAIGERVAAAEPAIAQLGTAFQIVDDLTDFEFDLGRRSHNLLVAQIHHHGSDAERARLARLWEAREAGDGLVEEHFADSARTVLELAREEARASFATLAQLGFWFPPDLADEVVHAIVGIEGVARMESLTTARGNG